MLFTAFIETWRISSDSRVFYARLVIDKCDQRPRTTLSSKKLKWICPTSKDVVVISVLFARWYIYLDLDVSNIGISKSLQEIGLF